MSDYLILEVVVLPPGGRARQHEDLLEQENVQFGASVVLEHAVTHDHVRLLDQRVLLLERDIETFVQYTISTCSEYARLFSSCRTTCITSLVILSRLTHAEHAAVCKEAWQA